MPRFFIPAPLWPAEPALGSLFTMGPEESHHARDVLRLKPGDVVRIFDGQGREVPCRVVETPKSGVRVEATGPVHTSPARPQLILAQAVPKGKTMEWILEKAVELGATAIWPLLTDRTIVRLDAAEARQKQEKWQKVALEACKQCGQNWLPEVALPCGLAASLNRLTPEISAVVAALHPSAAAVSSVVATWNGREHVVVFVGPEGDFTEKELAQLLQAGAAPISLGPLILRAETAALCSLSLLNVQINPVTQTGYPTCVLDSLEQCGQRD